MNKYEQIQNWLLNSKAIIILTGAGMGVDSGLADYRGNGGQWGNIETETEKSVFEIVNPKSFIDNPKFGWKMYASRLIEYTKTEPHDGFKILLKWIQQFNLDYFILTSNVDNQFQKSGFKKDKIRELHGSVFYLQCSIPCCKNTWKHGVNLETLQHDIENEDFPTCPTCGAISRPNVYMFRDNTYLPERSQEQKQKFEKFLEKNKDNSKIVFEIGSGPHVQSIRKNTRMLGIEYNAKIVRINPKDFKIKEPHIGIDKGALDALREIDRFI